MTNTIVVNMPATSYWLYPEACEWIQPAAFTISADSMTETGMMMWSNKVSTEKNRWKFHSGTKLPQLQIYFCLTIYPTSVCQRHVTCKYPANHIKECCTLFRFTNASHFFFSYLCVCVCVCVCVWKREFQFSMQVSALVQILHTKKQNKNHWWLNAAYKDSLKIRVQYSGRYWMARHSSLTFWPFSRMMGSWKDNWSSWAGSATCRKQCTCHKSSL